MAWTLNATSRQVIKIIRVAGQTASLGKWT